MNSINHAIELFLASLFAFIMAFVGGMVRLLHERAHGAPASWMRTGLVLVSAVLLGVIGQTGGEYLSRHYDFPAVTSGALAGFLGYLGPTFLDTLAALALKRAGAKEEEGKDETSKD